MQKFIIANGEIHDAVNPAGYIADIMVEDGKISAVAPGLAAGAGVPVTDAAGCLVYPGFVEGHCHIGLADYAHQSIDFNETNDPISPQMRAIDAFNPQEESVAMGLRGGITTVGTGPGSSDVIGGTFMAVKTFGTCVDEMVIRNPVAMKCALGENPRNRYKDKQIASRMTIAAKLRETLFKTQEYIRKREKDDKTAFDFKLESMIPVLKREIPLKVHCHQANDICTAIRIAREFDLKITIDHCTHGHQIVPQLQGAGFPVAIGPSMGFAKKLELCEKNFATPGILAKAGLMVSIITDAPVTELHYLPLMAGMAVNNGMDPFAALQAITINPAKMLGVDDRVGSLEVGKDADILVCTADPINEFTANSFRHIFVDGRDVLAER